MDDKIKIQIVSIYRASLTDEMYSHTNALTYKRKVCGVLDLKYYI